MAAGGFPMVFCYSADFQWKEMVDIVKMLLGNEGRINNKIAPLLWAWLQNYSKRVWVCVCECVCVWLYIYVTYQTCFFKLLLGNHIEILTDFFPRYWKLCHTCLLWDNCLCMNMCLPLDTVYNVAYSAVVILCVAHGLIRKWFTVSISLPSFPLINMTKLQIYF